MDNSIFAWTKVLLHLFTANKFTANNVFDTEFFLEFKNIKYECKKLGSITRFGQV